MAAPIRHVREVQKLLRKSQILPTTVDIGFINKCVCSYISCSISFLIVIHADLVKKCPPCRVHAYRDN